MLVTGNGCTTDLYNTYEKNYSSALTTTKTMNDLKVKNLILYHIEELHTNERKRLYAEEVERVFDGHVIVPNDIEVIEIEVEKNE